MRRPTIVVVGALLLGGAVLMAQGQAGSANTAPPDRARLEQVINAWASLDPSKASPFYAKDAGLAFYDVAPRKYSGWAEYDKGARDMFKDVKSMSMKLGTDAQVHIAGNVAWSTATVDAVMVNKDGSRMNVDARWTTVWEKRGNNWLIVHDHFSAPLPEPAPPAGAKPAPAPKK